MGLGGLEKLLLSFVGDGEGWVEDVYRACANPIKPTLPGSLLIDFCLNKSLQVGCLRVSEN